MSEAQNLSSKFVALLMEETYPNTGSNPEYTLNNWSYKANSEVYTLYIDAYWSGGCTIFSDKCNVSYSLVVQVTSNGEVNNYEITSMNKCAKEHVACDVVMSVGKIIGNNILSE